MITVQYVRWMVVVMLFGAAVLNYLDKQVLALLAPSIQKDLGLTDRDYANVTSCFLVAFTVSLVIAGRVLDRIGVRVGLALYVGWWSLANMAHAAARSVGSLAVCQAFLGCGEAGNWPASTKAVSEWIPVRERAFAIGAYTMGATLGATIAPVLIVALAGGGEQWRQAFLITGGAGLVWMVVWLLWYRGPAEHPWVMERERTLVAHRAAEITETADRAGDGDATWTSVGKRREVWLLLVGRMLTDPVWIFYQVWFAKYLMHDRAVAQQDVGAMWVVFLAADAGCLLGGILSAVHLRRGLHGPAARLRAMAWCLLLTPLSAFLPYAPSLGMCLMLAMAVVFAHLMWLTNISALLVDVMPPRQVATAFGIVAAGSTVGSVVMTQAVGRLASMGSPGSTDPVYTPWFLLAALLHPLAWLILHQGRIASVASRSR